MKVRLMLSALALGMIATSANAQAPATKQEPAKPMVKADTGKKMEAKGDMKKGAMKKGATKKAADSKKADTTKAATKKP